MKRRPRGSGSIMRTPCGEYAIRYGPRAAPKYESGYRTKAEAEQRLTLVRADALRPPAPPATPKALRRMTACAPFKTARMGGGCEACGWKPPEPLTARALHVHHVIQVRDGGDDAETNLLLLCPNHHALAHAARRILSGLTTREAVIAALRRIDPAAERSTEGTQESERDALQRLDLTA